MENNKTHEITTDFDGTEKVPSKSRKPLVKIEQDLIESEEFEALVNEKEKEIWENECQAYKPWIYESQQICKICKYLGQCDWTFGEKE